MYKSETNKYIKRKLRPATKYIKAIGYASVYILLFMTFCSQITDFLWDVNQKWMVDCNPLYGGLFVLTLCVLLMCLLCKYKDCIFGHHRMAGCIFAIFLYLYYRWLGEYTFNFWDFKFPLGDVHLAYTDGFLVVAVIAVVQQINAWRKGKKLREMTFIQNGLTPLRHDSPIQKMEDDELGYVAIANSLIADLTGVKLEKGSFSVGITGEWGAGKSSFFNILKWQLGKLGNVAIYTFNPRGSAKVTDIQQDFFDGFAEMLSKYHSGAMNVVEHYQEALQVVDEKWVSRLIKLFSSWTVDKGRERINSIIRETGKRIYVLIDDLDRLTGPEIMEVMKLIDRNGGFENTIFITAYDKTYVNGVLKSYLGNENNTDFTDKYFDHEQPLPPQPEDALDKVAKKHMKDVLTFGENDVETETSVMNQWNNVGEMILGHLHTLRHVKRYMNILLSRYNSVKNDVYFKDFALLTLIRYKDISLYHALVEGGLFLQGGQLTSNSNRVYYLKSDYEDDLKNITKWDGAKEILTQLFKLAKVHDFNTMDKYRRLQFVSSFPNYYYDYKPGELYYRDLIRLYNAPTDKEAYKVMDELLQLDKKQDERSMSRYRSVEDFLIQRRIETLRNINDVKRLLKLLLYLVMNTWRNTDVEYRISSLLYNWQSEKCEETGIVVSAEEYKNEMNASISEAVNEFPMNMGFILLQINDGILQNGGSITDLLFSQRQIREWGEECQRVFIAKEKENPSITTMDIVLTLSKIFENKDDVMVSKRSKKEFLEFIGHKPDTFTSVVLKIHKVQSDLAMLQLYFHQYFNPDNFFSKNKKAFANWIHMHVRNPEMKELMLYVYAQKDYRIQIELAKEEQNIREDDLKSVWSIVRKRQENVEEDTVMANIGKHVALSYEILMKDTGYSKKTIKRAILRLINKGKLTREYCNLAKSVAPFQPFDFVRIKEETALKYKKEEIGYNIFKITTMGGNTVELTGLEGKVQLDDVEAIPIDGKHDIYLYYAPAVIPAKGGAVSTDESYYMDSFKLFYDDKKAYAEIVKENKFHFVHEVQHWLRKKFGHDDLKVKYHAKPATGAGI